MTDEIFEDKQKKVTELFNKALEQYHKESCPCAYPRFLQFAGINCSNSGDSFRCWETEILINVSKKHFEITDSNLTNENLNQTWICKKCLSTYEYGWSDFSIHVERQKLQLTNLKATSIGKQPTKPIPLFLGLFGHSYPKKTEMDVATFEELEKYILEDNIKI